MTNYGTSRMRLYGFMRKEFLQIRRDPSSLLLALVLPVVLLFLFGYGLSLNPNQVPVAVVVADQSAVAGDLAARFELSTYFRPIFTTSVQTADAWVKNGRVDGFVHIRRDFTADLLGRNKAPVQVVVNGVDANRAALIQGYARGTIQKWLEVAAWMMRFAASITPWMLPPRSMSIAG